MHTRSSSSLGVSMYRRRAYIAYCITLYAREGERASLGTKCELVIGEADNVGLRKCVECRTLHELSDDTVRVVPRFLGSSRKELLIAYKTRPRGCFFAQLDK